MHMNYDYFNLDDVEQEILSSKPTSFLVVGLPHSGRKRLARLISERWNCVYVDVTDLCNELAEEKAFPPNILNALYEGKAISEKELSQEISKHLRSDFISHSGYILTGMPGMEHCDVSMIRDEINDLKNLYPNPDFIIHLKIDDEDILDLVRKKRLDPVTGEIYTREDFDMDVLTGEMKEARLKVSGSTTSSITDLSDVYQDNEESVEPTTTMSQFQSVFSPDASLKKKLSIPPDVMQRLITPLEFMPHGIRTVLEFCSNSFVPIFQNEYLCEWNRQKVFELNALKSSEVLLEEVMERLKCFHTLPALPVSPFHISLKELEKKEKAERKAQGTPEIKALKWGASKSSMYEGNLTRAFGDFSKTALDQILNTYSEEEKEGSFANVISENESDALSERGRNVEGFSQINLSAIDLSQDGLLTKEEFSKKISNLSPIDPKWSWLKSRWFHYCPVALTKGVILPGRSEYLVSFLDKIYALSSREALKSFVQNPRKFLHPPMPKNHCKVVIIGYPYSGKTTISHSLAKHYRAHVIDVQEILEPALASMRENFRTATVGDIIKVVKDKIITRTFKRLMRKKGLNPKKVIEPTQSELIKEEAGLSTLDQQTVQFGSSKDELQGLAKILGDDEEKMDEPRDEDMGEAEEEEDEEEEEEEDGEEEEENDEEGSYAHMPGFSDFLSSIDPNGKEFAVTEDHPEVREALQAAMENYKPEISSEGTLNLIRQAIQDLQKDLRCKRKEEILDGGWVLDNFPIEINHWEALMKSEPLTRPTTVFCLTDDSKLKEVILSRWYSINRRNINEQIISRIKDSIINQMVEERKSELESLFDELQLGEDISLPSRSDRQQKMDENLDYIQGDFIPNDALSLILASVDSGPNAELSGFLNHFSDLSVKIKAPQVEDESKWIKEKLTHIISYHSQLNQYEEDTDDDDSDEKEKTEEENTSQSNINKNSFSPTELSFGHGGTRKYTLGRNRFSSRKFTSPFKRSGATSQRSDTISNYKHRQSGKKNILTSLGLSHDAKNENFIKNLSKFAVPTTGSMAEFMPFIDVTADPEISKTNIMDNVSSTSSEDFSDIVSEEHEDVQVICLIHSLLDILSYIPLDGPERLAKENELHLIWNKLNSIMEFLKQFNVLAVKIPIGIKLDAPKVLFVPPYVQSSKKVRGTQEGLGQRVVLLSKIIANTENARALEQAKGKETDPAEGASTAPSSDMDHLAKIMEDDTMEEEEELLPENTTTFMASLMKVKRFETLFQHMKYFRGLFNDIENLISQRWDSRNTFNIVDEMVKLMEDLFRHKAVEGIADRRLSADEEEVDQVEEEEKEEEEKEFDEKTNEVQRAYANFNLGDSSYFCPVTLKEKRILHPGSVGIAATYKDEVYFFSSEEAQQKFLKWPEIYMAGKFPLEVPPLRLIIMGHPGSGKSTISRHLVDKLGICHIQFRKYLQEMIITRTKKAVLGDAYKVEDVEDINMLEKEEVKERLRAMGMMTWEAKKKNYFLSNENPELTEETPMEKAKTPDDRDSPSLTEKDQAIINYLTSDDSSARGLPKSILEEVLKEFWNGSTFEKSGFILEDFPNDEMELRQMTEFGLYPDAVLILEADVGQSIKRMLPNFLKKWKEKSQKRSIFRENLREAYKAIKAEAKMIRAKELTEIRARALEILAEKSVSFYESGIGITISQERVKEITSLQNFIEDFDLETMLKIEFDEDEHFEVEEEEEKDDAKERFEQIIIQSYENAGDMMNGFTDIIQELQIPVISINTSKKLTSAFYNLNQKLEPFLMKRNSLFEKVIPVSETLADKMIKQGYRFLSRFNRWCPVKLLEGVVTFPSANQFAAIHRGFVYFFSSKAARSKFMHNPLYYLCNAQTKTYIPIKTAIIGPPKSGKTTIANRVMAEYGARRLSSGDAIRQVLQDYPKSNLAKVILTALYSGFSVSDELTAKAIAKTLLDTDCNTNGYILDGCPVSKGLMEALENLNIIPFRVIYLNITDEQLKIQAANLQRDFSELPYHDSENIFNFQLETYKLNEPPILSWYKGERNALFEVEMERSKWWVWIKVVSIINEGLGSIRNYCDGIFKEGVASLSGMNITHSELREKLGHFEEFCPVSLIDRDELVDLSQSKTIEHAAEFRGMYYRLAGKAELASFLKSPNSYASNFCLPPPMCRPVMKTQEEISKMFKIKVGLLGFCPVTYLEGDQLYSSLARGKDEFAVQYLDTVYYFVNQENMLKFMRSPKKYYALKNPTIIPPDLPPLKVNSLPIPGYLEQSVSQDIIKALTAVGNLKPKYPFLSPQESAVTYVALFLKAHNLKSSAFARKRFHRKLKEFEARCDLIRYLDSNMSRNYKEESERPSGFDKKLEEFFRLDVRSGKETRKLSFI